MFQVTRPSATASTVRIVLTLATAGALAAGPVASATAMRVPEPSTTQIGWQSTASDLATEARSASSLAARRMLHSELTMVLHSHRVG